MAETMLGTKGVSRLARAVAGLRAQVGARVRRADLTFGAVFAGTASYAAVFVFAAVIHYVVFRTPRFDLGNMVQATSNTLHGHFLESTTPTGHQVDRLGFHVDPFLLLMAPLFWVWSSPLLFPVVQVLAVASGAFPVFWLARKRLGSPRAGANLAFAYLLYPATQFSAFTPTSFHPNAIAVPLVLYAVWFLDEDRLVMFSAIALLAFTTKEEIPLSVGCLGIWCAIRKGHRMFGLAVFCVGLVVTAFNFIWVVPHLSPGGVEPFAHRYRAVGGTPLGIGRKLFTDPLAFVHVAATDHNVFYVLLLLGPFLCLSLLEPLLLLGALPDLAINVLSSTSDRTSIPSHWTSGMVPFVVAASILGAARFRRHASRLSVCLLAAVGLVAVVSPIYYLAHDVPALSSPQVSAQARATSLIPQGVPVSASNLLGAHLSARRYLYAFPIVKQSEWIVVDPRDPTYVDGAGLRRLVRVYESKKLWRVVFFSQGVVVLHKLHQESERAPALR